jgi:hypothetical protein
MRDARVAFGLVLLGNGLVLAAGGRYLTGTLSTAELYDPSTGIWTPTGSMHDAAGSAGYAVLSSSSEETTVLRAAGLSGASYMTTAEIYSASTGTWASTGSLNNARSGFGIVKLTSGDVLVSGGVVGTTVLSGAERYSTADGTWSNEPSMNNARSRFRLVLLTNGAAMAIGGFYGTGYLSTAEIFL